MRTQTLLVTTLSYFMFLSACGSEVISECFVSENIEVYADLNRNGQRDVDEPPLEGIEVRFFEIDSGRQVGNTFKTDSAGRATVGFISGGDCNPDDYDVSLRIFLNDYEGDSISSVTLREVQEAGDAYQFGLIPNPAPTPDIP